MFEPRLNRVDATFDNFEGLFDPAASHGTYSDRGSNLNKYPESLLRNCCLSFDAKLHPYETVPLGGDMCTKPTECFKASRFSSFSDEVC